jgi:hypothetical protein
VQLARNSFHALQLSSPLDSPTDGAGDAGGAAAAAAEDEGDRGDVQWLAAHNHQVLWEHAEEKEQMDASPWPA